MIGTHVVILGTEVRSGMVVACEIDPRGKWQLLVVCGDRVIETEPSNVRIVTPDMDHIRAMARSLKLAPMEPMGMKLEPVHPPPVETVATATIYGPGTYMATIPGQKYMPGTRVRRKPCIDPPMAEAIFTVATYNPSFGMHGKPRYWGPDAAGAMEAGYEDQLEEIK